jgi:hypothetical protein
MAKVHVRIAVAVDKAGNWNSCGSKGMPDEDASSIASEVVEEGEKQYWLTADLDIPEETEIKATVDEA